MLYASDIVSILTETRAFCGPDSPVSSHSWKQWHPGLAVCALIRQCHRCWEESPCAGRDSVSPSIASLSTGAWTGARRDRRSENAMQDDGCKRTACEELRPKP